MIELHEWLYSEPPEPTQQEQQLWELAREYYRRTELYDRRVCSGVGRDGQAVPIGYREMGQINRHAGQVLRELRERCGAPLRLRRAMAKYLESSEFRRDLQALGTFTPSHLAYL